MTARRFAIVVIALGALAGAPDAAPVAVRPPSAPAETLARPVLTPDQANQAAGMIRAAEAECATKPEEYRIDCLRYGLWDVTRRLNRDNAWRGESLPVVRELETLQQDLKRLVEANADRAAPRLPVRRKQLQAVNRATLPQVNAAARARIAETETRLLRSSGTASRQLAFTQVAQALGSTKRILRS